MGATLPAISRWTAATPAGASTVGMLYMANIGGGAFGTMVAGFYLLRVHDTMVATAVAVATNALGAAFAWWLTWTLSLYAAFGCWRSAGLETQ